MKLSQFTPLTWKRFSIIILLILVASFLRIWPLQSLGSTLAWVTFYPAVMIISVYCGLWAGLLGTLLTCLTVNFLWFLMVSQPFIRSKADYIGMGVFILTGVMISVVSEAIRLANRRAVEAEKQISQIKLSKSRQRFQTTLDNLLEGCQIIDFEWRYIYINAAAEKHGRRSASELMGNIFMEMWPGIESTKLFKVLSKCMTERISDMMVNEFAYPDGTSSWFNLSIQPVPEGIFILSTDITKHVQTEKYNLMANEILEQLNQYTDTRTMLTSVIRTIKEKTGYEAIAIRIREGEDFPYFTTAGFSDEFVRSEKHLCSYDKHGNILRNSSGDAILDCMCGNILCGRVDSSKSFFTEGGSFRSNNTSRLLESTTPVERLARTRNKCNSAGYESVGLIPLRSGDEIIGLLQLNDHRMNVFNEETIPFFERIGSSIGIAIVRNKIKQDLKKLNEELENRIIERTNQLKESNMELESFAYSVSHDLRAPLRHIFGFTEKLEKALKDTGDPEITRLTGKIKTSASKMSCLIDELLTYSRLGRMDLRTTVTSLNPIVEEIIDESRDLNSGRQINWKIQNLPEVKVDQTLIRLVLQNLINNAVKFTGKKQEADVEIGFQERNKHEYLFYVKDNGAGFNMQYADKLFGVFQRLHTNEEFEGTGIGLATVRRIIKRHSGTVWAEGKENEGASFFFTLPKYKEV